MVKCYPFSQLILRVQGRQFSSSYIPLRYSSYSETWSESIWSPAHKNTEGFGLLSAATRHRFFSVPARQSTRTSVVPLRARNQSGIQSVELLPIVTLPQIRACERDESRPGRWIGRCEAVSEPERLVIAIPAGLVPAETLSWPLCRLSRRHRFHSRL